MCHGVVNTRSVAGITFFGWTPISLYVQRHYQLTMGQILSAARQCLSAFTGGRRGGSVRLTEQDEESAPAAGTSMPIVAQAPASPKPTYIAYVAVTYPRQAAILMITPGSWAQLGVESQRSVNRSSKLTLRASHSQHLDSSSIWHQTHRLT